MSEGKRPDWPYKTPIETARWLASHFVDKLTAHREMTGVDTCDDWIEAHSGRDKRRVVVGYRNDGEVVFNSMPPNLLELRDDVRKRLDEINGFDRKNARDLADYKRLKAKFEAGK